MRGGFKHRNNANETEALVGAAGALRLGWTFRMAATVSKRGTWCLGVPTTTPSKSSESGCLQGKTRPVN